jgi:hypothetical protein
MLDTHFLAFRCAFAIPTPAKSLPEGSQTTSFVFLDIEQLLRARVPHHSVSNIFVALVDRRRRCRSMKKGRAIGERDELSECVRPFRPAYERRIQGRRAGETPIGCALSARYRSRQALRPQRGASYLGRHVSVLVVETKDAKRGLGTFSELGGDGGSLGKASFFLADSDCTLSATNDSDPASNIPRPSISASMP